MRALPSTLSAGCRRHVAQLIHPGASPRRLPGPAHSGQSPAPRIPA
jgi:hypothetical protein